MSGIDTTQAAPSGRHARLRAGFAAAAVSIAVLGVTEASPPASAVSNICAPRTPVRTGAVSWKLRQASGLTTVPESPGVLFTHNDRGIRDNPAPGEDTTYAAVWAMTPTGTILARFRLVDSTGAPIPYFDTEAISTAPPDPADPQHRTRIVLADTGTNVDQRVTVALYRFTPPVVTPGQAYVSADVTAQVIPIQYFNTAKSTTAVKLNVEAFTVAPDGSAWFVPRTSSLPYSYTASADALDQAAATQIPLRAVRATRFTVDGPMTDASISPDHSMLLVKSMTVVYGYDLTGTDVVHVLGTDPCAVASASTASDPGYGEAIAPTTTVASTPSKKAPRTSTPARQHQSGRSTRNGAPTEPTSKSRTNHRPRQSGPPSRSPSGVHNWSPLPPAVPATSDGTALDNGRTVLSASPARCTVSATISARRL